MYVVEQDKVELIYDIIVDSALVLNKSAKLKFFEGIIATCENIMMNDIEQDVDVETENELKLMYKKLDDVNFNQEEVRKALQLAILRAFKEEKLENGAMTPDTISYIFGYIISKFFKGDGTLRIFDPLVGTGNLLSCVANSVEQDVSLVGVDNDEFMIRLAKVVCNMQDYDPELYFQDTSASTFNNIDVIVSDLPSYSGLEDDGLEYFPHIVVNKHLSAVKPDGLMVYLIPFDFFNGNEAALLRKKITDVAHIIGLIELPESMFARKNKSILILRKNGKNTYVEEVLMAKLPSFTEIEQLRGSLIQIDMWFEKIYGGKEYENFSN